MSADNYITIRKEGRKWVGYHQSASTDEEQYNRPMFIATSLKKAIIAAQEEWTEYGYRIIGLTVG